MFASLNKNQPSTDLRKLKKEIKIWEKHFQKEQKRAPNADDIKKNPEMAQKYKVYNRSKRQQKSPDTVKEKSSRMAIFGDSKPVPEQKNVPLPVIDIEPTVTPSKTSKKVTFAVEKTEKVIKSESDIVIHEKEAAEVHEVKEEEVIEPTLEVVDSFDEESLAPNSRPAIKFKRSASLAKFAQKYQELQLQGPPQQPQPQSQPTQAQLPEQPPTKKIKVNGTNGKQEIKEKENAQNTNLLAQSFKGSRTNYVKMNLKSNKGKGTWKNGKFTRTPSRGKVTYSRSYTGQYQTTDGDNPFVANDNLWDVDYEFDDYEDEFSEKQTKDSMDIDHNQRSQYSREQLLDVLKKNFGFDTFRVGQEEAIQRVLSGLSTLLVIPTGSGKSLCYQLPSFLSPSPSLTLVVSPLLSLINDQIRSLPPCLTGCCLTSQQSDAETQRIITDLCNNKIKILFVSPEKLITEKFIALLASLPPISFACIDEAHCVSEWSHNFRTSYLRLGKVLRQRLNVKCILALTATATKRTELSIVSALGIPSDGVIRTSTIRPNLHLTVSHETDRDQALVKLLKNPPYSSSESTIIYCMFKRTADEVAQLLQVCTLPLMFIDICRQRNMLDAASYHSGKSLRDRNQIQDLFMNNKLKIVVATVAFGMGIDKQDVRCVIHYHLPKSLENYIQEVGRAGRDGLPAHCHLFLSEEDYASLRSFAYSDSIDLYTAKQVVQKLFSKPAQLAQSKNGTFLKSISLEGIEMELDIKKEVVATILSLLELENCLRILPSIQFSYFQHLLTLTFTYLHTTCTVGFHKTDTSILAERYPIISWILNNGKKVQGKYSFDFIDAVNASSYLINQLQAELSYLKREAKEISFEMTNESYCVKVYRLPEDLVEMTNKVMVTLQQLENSQVHKVDMIFLVLKHCADEAGNAEGSSDSLHKLIDDYFVAMDPAPLALEIPKTTPKFLVADIRVLVTKWSERITSGRAVARIFHGLSTPMYPASEWGRHPSWGRYKDVDFNHICQLATNELIALKQETGGTKRKRQ